MPATPPPSGNGNFFQQDNPPKEVSMQGETVRVEFVSADATTAAEITLWNADGSQRQLGAKERVVLYDLVVSAAAATVLLTIFSDDDDDNTIDAGERLAEFVTTGNLATSISFGLDGQPGARGIMPHVIADTAGQVSITGRAGIQSV